LARLRILGKEVTIGCRPGEEDALKQAAAYIDSSMRDLKSRNATSSLEKIAIVTAINTADALLKARARVAQPEALDKAMQDRLSAMNVSIASVLAQDDGSESMGETRDASD